MFDMLHPWMELTPHLDFEAAEELLVSFLPTVSGTDLFEGIVDTAREVL